MAPLRANVQLSTAAIQLDRDSLRTSQRAGAVRRESDSQMSAPGPWQIFVFALRMPAFGGKVDVAVPDCHSTSGRKVVGFAACSWGHKRFFWPRQSNNELIGREGNHAFSQS